MSLPIIAIVGRPNVGKSALFNCILRKRVAIVHEQSGVTRDRITAPAEHFGKKFLLVDTGGLGVHHRENTSDIFDGLIREQVAEIVKEASVLIWVVNIQDGITIQDEEVADYLHKCGKPIVIAANKGDNEPLRASATGLFAKLGIQEIHPVSCMHTVGISDLLEATLALVPQEAWQDEEQKNENRLKVAVVGRPNVGKSSLVNKILGRERVMVSDIPGTTRDAIDEPVDLEYDGIPLPITIIDTAGMRRKKQVDTVVEFFSLSRSENAISRCDMVIFMLDATDPCTSQERRIGHIIVEAKKPCLLLANKWDLARKENRSEKKMIERIRQEMPFMAHAPLLLVSVLKGFNFKEIAGRMLHVREQMGVKVPTAILNQFLQDIMARNPPPSTGLKSFKLFYGTMTTCPPPTFRLFVNKRSLCPANYLQYLENQLREAFYPEAGLPIVLELRERESHKEDTTDGKRQAAAGVKRKRESNYQSEHRRISRARGKRKKK
ncbi:MAG: ribosome biogenesis GTPase Der [Victivallales bacterium]|nr:ribosome biogenesis GTPase Der [Victivallales bacterium]